ncbi:hypothetical protein [Alphaproteobacteria bacterium endosymbiont of Tiliacea citrago]|uniref:hypothetical protein n=1 Tax=Alphaproteobacteria bacterium endosymbiont of Tiliacea citrago TaxID=3077944 RepID=UPI00313B6F70
MFTSVIKKKGRPCKFVENTKYLIEKKEFLFGSNSKAKYMNIVNVAYNSNKITAEERDMATYLETLYFHMKKDIGVKSIPKASPSTWTVKIKFSYNQIIKSKEKALNDWNLVKNYIQKFEPMIASEFLSLICDHHNYEELLALKMNFQIMDILKKGLSCIKKMFNNY